MKTDNNTVSSKWGQGQDVSNYSDTLRVTANHEVYSYDLLIGYHDKETGALVAIDYRAPNFVSMTTSKHVSMIAWRADVARDPTEKELSNAW